MQVEQLSGIGELPLNDDGDMRDVLLRGKGDEYESLEGSFCLDRPTLFFPGVGDENGDSSEDKNNEDLADQIFGSRPLCTPPAVSPDIGMVIHRKSPRAYPATPVPNPQPKRIGSVGNANFSTWLKDGEIIPEDSEADTEAELNPANSSSNSIPRRQISSGAGRLTGSPGVLRRTAVVRSNSPGPHSPGRLISSLPHRSKAHVPFKSNSTTTLPQSSQKHARDELTRGRNPRRKDQLAASAHSPTSEGSRPGLKRRGSTGSLSIAIANLRAAGARSSSPTPQSPGKLSSMTLPPRTRSNAPVKSNSTTSMHQRSQHARGRPTPLRRRSLGSLKNAKALKLDEQGKPVLQSILRKGRYGLHNNNNNKQASRRNMRTSRSPSFRGSIHRRRKVSFDLPDEISLADSFATEESMQFGDWGLEGEGGYDSDEPQGFHSSCHESMRSSKSWTDSMQHLNSDDDDDDDDDGNDSRGDFGQSFGQLADYESFSRHRNSITIKRAEPCYFDYEEEDEEIEPSMEEEEEDYDECLHDAVSSVQDAMNSFLDNSLSSLDEKASSDLGKKIKAIDELGGASTVVLSGSEIHFSGFDDEALPEAPATVLKKEESSSSEASSESPTGVLDFRKFAEDDDDSVGQQKNDPQRMLPPEEFSMALKG